MALTDKQLRAMCLEFRKGLLAKMSSQGKCAMVSWALQGFLSFAVKLKTEVHESQVEKWNHLYLVMPDGRVIDCTADQFNEYHAIKRKRKFPQVYIGKPLSIHNGKRFEATV